MDKKVEPEFDSIEFEKRLMSLKDTQDSIQAMSAWCLQNRSFHKKIVTSWLGILKQVKVEQRLTLFYLANDVIQYSKRKNYDFVDSWGTALQRATTMVRDEKVKQKIERIFNIWEQRAIYNEEFLADLNGLLSINPAKKPQMNENDDEQASITITNVKNCMRLEKETDKMFKLLPKAPFYDTESLNILKDRRHVEEVEREVRDSRTKLENYVKTLSSEIKARSILITVLDQSTAFYHNQRGEVKVVANAYRNFGNRIKTMKRKLEELTKTLPSPIPSPDINAPSPGPADNDFVLPGEKDFDQTVFSKQTNGFMGYMDSGNLPFDISDFNSKSPKSNETQPIQVISSAGPKEDFNIDEFFKSLMPDVYNPTESQPRPVPSPASSYVNYTPHAEYVPPLANPYNSMPQYGQNTYNTGLPSNNIYAASPINSYRPPMNSAYPPVPQPPPPFAPTTNTYTPLPPPPPLPPAFKGDDRNEYNPDNWEMDMSWNTSQDTSFNQTLDGPRSPPHFERKGHNANLIEYVDPSIDGHITGSGDVDHRQLLVPPVGTLLKSGNGRPVDVDHRNLISLTGSPKTGKDLRAASDALQDKGKDRGHLEPSDVFGLSQLSTSTASDNKLVPPPSPPASLLAPSVADNTLGAMNPPQVPSRFPNSPTQKSRTPTKSPGRSQNGRDNTEAIDMEMSDEDFETLPEFLEAAENISSTDLADDRNSSNILNNESQPLLESPLQPPPNLFDTTSVAYMDVEGWDGTTNNSFDTPVRNNPFNSRSNSMRDPTKRPNPFSEKPNPHDILQLQQLQQQQQQQQLLMQQQQRIGRASNPGPGAFNSQRGFLYGNGPGTGGNEPHGEIDSFMMNSNARGPPPPFMQQQQQPPPQQQSPMNFRGPRNSSPYFRNDKNGGVGGRGGGTRGGFRANFRGRNW